jgi:hypothetical protein
VWTFDCVAVWWDEAWGWGWRVCVAACIGCLLTVRVCNPHTHPLFLTMLAVCVGPCRYVSDDDRVAINVMDYACSSSIGAHRAPSIQQKHPQQQPSAESTTSSGTATSSSSGHLALSSGIYGSMQSVDNSLFGSSTLDMPSAAKNAGASSSNQQEPMEHYDTCMPLPPFAMRAGPREHIYFDPATVTAAIVTTGELHEHALAHDHGPGHEHVLRHEHAQLNAWRSRVAPECRCTVSSSRVHAAPHHCVLGVEVVCFVHKEADRQIDR